MLHVAKPDLRNGRTPVLGNLLRAEREAAGLSQAMFAAQIGVSRPYLSRLERGKYAHPSPGILARMAKLLHISADDLYAVTGYVLPTDLPSFGAYLRARHPDWPEAVLAEIEDFYWFIRDKYSLQ
jgi:transcriptional regulator with XRE-family HTH domain